MALMGTYADYNFYAQEYLQVRIRPLVSDSITMREVQAN